MVASRSRTLPRRALRTEDLAPPVLTPALSTPARRSRLDAAQIGDAEQAIAAVDTPLPRPRPGRPRDPRRRRQPALRPHATRRLTGSGPARGRHQCRCTRRSARAAGPERRPPPGCPSRRTVAPPPLRPRSRGVRDIRGPGWLDSNLVGPRQVTSHWAHFTHILRTTEGDGEVDSGGVPARENHGGGRCSGRFGGGAPARPRNPGGRRAPERRGPGRAIWSWGRWSCGSGVGRVRPRRSSPVRRWPCYYCAPTSSPPRTPCGWPGSSSSARSKSARAPSVSPSSSRASPRL